MTDGSRRKFLAAIGASPGLVAAGAGCLDRGSDAGDDAGGPDGRDDAGSLTLLERWVPADGSSELLFHYRDLADVRAFEDDLRQDVADSIPRSPDVEQRDLVESVADGEAAIDAVCRFGSKGVVGNVVVAGSFDPDAVDVDRESSIGEFGVLERGAATIAVSETTIVIGGDDGADLEAILAAGVEGTDRRIDAGDNFAPMLERLRDATIVWGEHEDRRDEGLDGGGTAFSWTFGADTVTHSVVGAYAESDRVDEFEREFAESEDVSIEIDGTVAVASRTTPTEEYEFRDLFAERGESQRQEVYAGVSIDVFSERQSVRVRYLSAGNADHVVVRDDQGTRETLTEVGEATKLEYEAGDSGTITVVAVGEERESTVATESFEF